MNHWHHKDCIRRRLYVGDPVLIRLKNRGRTYTGVVKVLCPANKSAVEVVVAELGRSITIGTQYVFKVPSHDTMEMTKSLTRHQQDRAVTV